MILKAEFLFLELNQHDLESDYLGVEFGEKWVSKESSGWLQSLTENEKSLLRQNTFLLETGDCGDDIHKLNSRAVACYLQICAMFLGTDSYKEARDKPTLKKYMDYFAADYHQKDLQGLEPAAVQDLTVDHILSDLSEEQAIEAIRQCLSFSPQERAMFKRQYMLTTTETDFNYQTDDMIFRNCYWLQYSFPKVFRPKASGLAMFGMGHSYGKYGIVLNLWQVYQSQKPWHGIVIKSMAQFRK